MGFFGGGSITAARHFAEYFGTTPGASQAIVLPLLQEETLYAPAVGPPLQVIVLPLLQDETIFFDLALVVGPQTIVLPLIHDEVLGTIAVIPVALWPSSPFPQVLQEKGYRETPPLLALRFKNEVGPANTLGVATKGVRVIKGTLILRQDGTNTEVAQLDEFYMTTLFGGSKDFNWQLSRLPYTAGRFRFVKPPVYVDLGGGNFEANLELEMLPD